MCALGVAAAVYLGTVSGRRMEIEFLSTRLCLFPLVQDSSEVCMEQGGIRWHPKLLVQREEYGGICVQTDLGLLSGSSTYWLSDLGQETFWSLVVLQ